MMMNSVYFYGTLEGDEDSRSWSSGSNGPAGAHLIGPDFMH